MENRTTAEVLKDADKLQTHMEMTDQLQVAELIAELSAKLREREVEIKAIEKNTDYWADKALISITCVCGRKIALTN